MIHLSNVVLIFLQIFIVILQVGSIIFLYSLAPIYRVMAIVSYIIIAPAITWLLKRLLRSVEHKKVYFISLFISVTALSVVIVFLRHFDILTNNDVIINYISALLFVVLLYYVYGTNYSNKKNDEKRIKDFYSNYFFWSKDYNLYFIRTIIFLFFTFTLIFGHLRDLGLHNSTLFIYEQYAIILIIAFDRIVINYNMDLSRVKDHIKRKKEKAKAIEKEELFQMFDDKLTEEKEQFELLLRINPEYDIERLDLWDNANDSEHPQTKLLYLYLVFNIFSEGISDKIDELFILTGKSVNRSLKKDECNQQQH